MRSEITVVNLKQRDIWFRNLEFKITLLTNHTNLLTIQPINHSTIQLNQQNLKIKYQPNYYQNW